MSDRWKCAVVGTGTVGQTHVRVLSNLPSAQLVAVCDVKPDHAKSVLEKHNAPPVPIYDNFLTMLDKEKVDVVHIATPSGAHHDIAIEAMKRGKHVISEKPLEIQL